jgi:hypothetical protein
MIEINAPLMRKCKSDKLKWGAGYKAAYSVIYEVLGKCKFTVLDILAGTSGTVSHTLISDSAFLSSLTRIMPGYSFKFFSACNFIKNTKT